VAKIAFTGSTGSGKHVHEVTSAALKHLTLELGGISPGVICIFVQEDAREEFAGLLAKAMAAFTPRDPLDPATLRGRPPPGSTWTG
jgi:acyl-CoA reductase-like NAD-dependent aldehyde dehydrogenase